jgi:hypothetical protein
MKDQNVFSKKNCRKSNENRGDNIDLGKRKNLLPKNIFAHQLLLQHFLQ